MPAWHVLRTLLPLESSHKASPMLRAPVPPDKISAQPATKRALVEVCNCSVRPRGQQPACQHAQHFSKQQLLNCSMLETCDQLLQYGLGHPQCISTAQHHNCHQPRMTAQGDSGCQVQRAHDNIRKITNKCSTQKPLWNSNITGWTQGCATLGPSCMK